MKKQNQLPCPEWADKLALRQDDLSPAEHAALQAHLITCSACMSTLADYQDLIARLRALPRPEAGPALRVFPELFLDAESWKRGNHMENKNVINEQNPPEIFEPAPSSLPVTSKRKPWRQRGLALTAALLLVLLVFSFALLSIRLRTGNTGVGGFHLTSGWTPFAFYQGTGSKTIKPVNLSLPAIWGDAETCQGNGGLDISIAGPEFDGGYSTNDCSAITAPGTAPAHLTFTWFSETLRSIPLQTIKVSAPASMTWSLLLVKETPQPAFSLSSAWVSTIGIGGGATTIEGNVLGPLAPDGHSLPPPSRWAILTLCVGGGQGSFQLVPSAGKISFPPCNGQPALHIVDYPLPTALQDIKATASGDIVWIAEVLACSKTESELCH